MSEVFNYYGKSFTKYNSSFDKKINNKLVCCVGIGIAKDCDWYGIISNKVKISPYDICICEYCAKSAFKNNEIYKITNKEFPSINPTSANCDFALNADILLKYGYDRKSLHWKGIRMNINHLNPLNDSDFRPAPTLPNMDSLKEKGILIVQLPTDSYWEVCISPDPNDKYSNGDYWMRIKMNSKNGDKVYLTNQHGKEGYYTKMRKNKPKCINAYKKGEGNRFMFISPPNEILESEDVSFLNINKSNIFDIEIEISKRKKYFEPKISTVYLEKNISSYMNGAPGRQDNTSGYPSTKEYSSGANVAAPGYSSGIKSNFTNDTFEIQDTINITLQIVCNQSNNDKLQVAKENELRENELRKKELFEIEETKKLLEKNNRAKTLKIQ